MQLSSGWEVLGTEPGRFDAPGELDVADLPWRPATVPGTAAGAIGDDGRDFDADDWWFRCSFEVERDRLGGAVTLDLEGIATVSEVYLNGAHLTGGLSMWERQAIDVSAALAERNELVIVCRALTPLLDRRRRPRARWRTRVVNASNLRWYRTMVFGRSPGFASGPATVGPWRPISLHWPLPQAPTQFAVRSRLDEGAGVVTVRAPHDDATVDPAWTVDVAGNRATARSIGNGMAEAIVHLKDVELWWPHTHGTPTLFEVSVMHGDKRLLHRRVGFRSLRYPDDIVTEGLALEVNGVAVFARGAVWTPPDLLTMAPTVTDLRRILTLVRDAGMNMLRIAGTGAYESTDFHDLCDDLGILLWQDLMFANLDYPLDDPEFAETARREARQVVDDLAHRPSLVALCGNSEVEQQPAMMGLDPALGRHPFWEQTIPQVIAAAGVDAAYIRSTPCGGDLPFHPDRGVTHYFGVSGYFHPVSDARRADVRFASECLAFANVPDEVEVPAHHPRWKAGVQRDAGTGWDIGAGWDFDDVRDHYVATLYGVDPVQLRRSEHARYLDLGRAATGEVMAEVIGEWRREESRCRGALVLWLKDMLPGAGLGVLDHRGAPKVAFHHLRRAMAPVAVWSTDEGLAGVSLHVANDRDRRLAVRLRVALYRDGNVRVTEASEELALPAHGVARRSVEGMVGHFLDAAWAYRFGPPAADVIVATLESDDPARPLSQTFRFCAERPLRRERLAELGLEARLGSESGGVVSLTISSRRLAYGVRILAPGCAAEDDAFCLEPGHERIVRLNRKESEANLAGATITALNLAEPLHVSAPGDHDL
jgi:beta-mannosidase